MVCVFGQDAVHALLHQHEVASRVDDDGRDVLLELLLDRTHGVEALLRVVGDGLELTQAPSISSLA